MRRGIMIIGLLVMFLSGHTQTGIPKAQAMFIYNFSRLIEWPSNYKSGQFIIGVLGSSPTYNELLKYTAGKSVGNQPISVKKFNSVAEITTCHILFVPFAKTKTMSTSMQMFTNKSTLLVTEKNGAIDDGAAVNFLVVGNTLKFELKPSNATKYKIRMSSKMNEMAYKLY